VRLTWTGVVGSALYAVLGLAWVSLSHPPGPPWLDAGWIVATAAVGAFIPGAANQVSLARAYLAAPALAYSVASRDLGLLAVAVSIASLTDLLDGTIARRFDRPSSLGAGLDPVVDGLFLGAVAMGLAVGGAFPLWLGIVVILRYLLPAMVGALLVALKRAPELRHTVSGQVSTTLNLVLLGGVALFRGLGQDASHLVGAAEVVIPVAAVATFIHLAWVLRGPRPGAGVQNSPPQ